MTFDIVEIYEVETGEDESAGAPVDEISPVGDTARRRPNDARLGYQGQGAVNTARALDALSEFDLNWSDDELKDALTSMDEEDSSYRMTFKGEVDDYEIDIAPEEVYRT